MLPMSDFGFRTETNSGFRISLLGDLRVPPAPRLPPSLKLWRDKLEDMVFFDIATKWQVTCEKAVAGCVILDAGCWIRLDGVFSVQRQVFRSACGPSGLPAKPTFIRVNPSKSDL